MPYFALGKDLENIEKYNSTDYNCNRRFGGHGKCF